ncbi:Hypothetical predicted protein [Octopus vulgaris]|uniref:Uncharacterized protein n=1 Tax=Octopus vulgaris TaxID=6645 RepID=A0AA36BX20_OCTVU|nr:Hypothetical predicted protein [Octopus vulgaris]
MYSHNRAVQINPWAGEVHLKCMRVEGPVLVVLDVLVAVAVVVVVVVFLLPFLLFLTIPYHKAPIARFTVQPFPKRIPFRDICFLERTP